MAERSQGVRPPWPVVFTCASSHALLCNCKVRQQAFQTRSGRCHPPRGRAIPRTRFQLTATDKVPKPSAPEATPVVPQVRDHRLNHCRYIHVTMLASWGNLYVRRDASPGRVAALRPRTYSASHQIVSWLVKLSQAWPRRVTAQ